MASGPRQPSSTTRFLPGPLRRLRGHLREIRRLVGETHVTLAEVREVATRERSALEEQLSRLETLTAQQQSAIERLAADHHADHRRLIQILRFVHDGGQARRRQLRRLRASPDYECAFREPEPLISVVIPTHQQHELLRDRSIPSVLAQSYERFELLVVGDAAPAETRQVVEAFDDPRLRFLNLPYRGPYPDDPIAAWFVSGVPAYNAGVATASGLWIAPLDDDDAWRPHHLERLLERARLDRTELVYSRLDVHLVDGEQFTIGRFPPTEGQFGVQAAMYHAGLREIFEYELADGALGLPADWALCLRMLEAGVRVGMLDEVTVDYYPSRSWSRRWEGDHLEPWQEAQDGGGEAPVTPTEPPEWEYVPEGWRRGSDPTQPAARGWHAEEVAGSYRAKWPQFLSALSGPEPVGVNHEVPAGAQVDRGDILHQNSILAFTYAITRAASASRDGSSSERLSVLDWGGALGHYRVLAERLLPEIELDYHCRELPHICAAGRELQPLVNFHESDECLEWQYDLVLVSNSLQYVEDWQPLFRRLAAAAARGWMFLTRVPQTVRHPSFVALQRAQPYGYGTELLGWVFNRDELLRTGASAGLTLEREFLLHPGWEIEGAPEAPTLAGFLFRS